MKHSLPTFLLGLLLFVCTSIFAQIEQTANDYVKPYDGFFGYGTNVGYYPKTWNPSSHWSVEMLGNLAIGNPAVGMQGAGVTTMRPSLPQWFQEQWGYGFRVPMFEHYARLGATDNVIFLGDPAQNVRDPNWYCPNERSALFANMYAPIWDDGENGTAINEDNHYALYVYKTVAIYKDYVKFWEVWNEPDFTRHGNYFDLPQNPGNWWENDPQPCEYKLKAPIYHYIRLLRISYEVIKYMDPDAYVAIGGLGYPSFLDAVLRNTDNPHDGTENVSHPLKGGAYFDVMSYHTYPHIDGSLRIWNEDRTQSTWKRNTDMAVDGILSLRQEFEDVLFKHGYEGEQYPQKEWIITESQAPRKPIRHQWGSDEVQVNFILKALVESQRHNIHQFHIFTIGDKRDFSEAYQLGHEYDLMGFYKNLRKAKPHQEKANDVTYAYKTASDLLYAKRFDHQAFEDLNLPDGVRGGAFKGEDGEIVYVLWAVIKDDRTENASKFVNLQEVLGTDAVKVKRWDHCKTEQVRMFASNNVHLTGCPIFIEAASTSDCVGENALHVELRNSLASECNANNGQFDVAITGGSGLSPYTITWNGPSSGEKIINGTYIILNKLSAGTYSVIVSDANGCTVTRSIVVADRQEDCSSCDDFSVQLRNPQESCGWRNGSFDVALTGGTGDINVEWSSNSTSGSQTISGRWLKVDNIPDGFYTIKVVDAEGCTDFAMLELACTCNSVAFDLKDPVYATCGQNNGKFDVTIDGNHPNFKIEWNGPISGNETISGRWYSIRNLPKGNYTVKVTDGTGCSKTKTIYLPEVGCGSNLSGNSSFQSQERAPHLAVFPNPSSGVFTASVMNSTGANIQVEIVDAVGRVIKQQQIQEIGLTNYQFDLSQQQNGLYFVRLTTPSGVQVKPLALMR